jgi:hypothetical protein
LMMEVMQLSSSLETAAWQPNSFMHLLQCLPVRLDRGVVRDTAFDQRLMAWTAVNH